MAARLPRLTAVLVLLLALLATVAQPAQAQDTVPAGQVITAETIRRAGITRLSELLTLAHRWDVETVDGFTLEATPLGGDPFRTSRWTIMVDGRRVEDQLFGTADLDRLGVPVEQVARVVLVEQPRLVAGGLTSGGLIHIITAEPMPGPSARGWFVTGSEIGDPGPFAFTPGARANVDRLGHGASAELGYGGERWFLSGSAAWSRTVPSDPAILDRYVAALGRVPRLRSTAPALRLGGLFGGGRHEAVLRHSHTDGALSLRPFGTELSSDEGFTMVGLAGDLPMTTGRMRYDASHAWLRLRRRGGLPGAPLDWRSHTSGARLELIRPRSMLELVGIRLRRREGRAPTPLSDAVVALATGYASLRVGDGTTASGAVTVGEGDLGLAALLVRHWGLGGGAALEAALSYERSSLGEDDRIWAWTERGYDLLEHSGVDFTVLGARVSPQRASADLTLAASPGRGIALHARALFRRSRGLSLERRELHYVPATTSFEGPATLVHGSGGELAGGSLELASRPGRGLALRASYWARDVLGGDAVFREAWSEVPGHGARAAVEYVPVAGLELRLAGVYRGPTRHRELAAVEAESGGRYRERVDGAFTLDAAVQKLLWDGRLRTHFGVRNLFGAVARLHPSGATFGPTAIVQLAGTLP